MPAIRQNSFLGGEVSPQRWGRTDLPEYARGCRALRNFFVSQDGAAVTRPGTVHLGIAEDTYDAVNTDPGASVNWEWVARSGSDPIRLIPFIYSDSQSYVLEFGHHYIRFWSNGALIEDPSSPPDPLKLMGPAFASPLIPYTGDDLDKIKYVQSGDVMFLVAEGYPPAKLTRLLHDDWEYEALDFTPQAASSKLLVDSLGTADGDHPAREWSWAVTEVWRDERSHIIRESAPHFITQVKTSPSYTDVPAAVPVYVDMPVEVELIDSSLLGAFLANLNFKTWRIYRGRGRLYGWVGDSRESTWKDVGQEPDYARAPPQGRNPFVVFDSNGAAVDLSYPHSVALFEERLVFGGSTEHPARIFASATGDYTNHDQRLLATPADAGEWELACRQREEVRGMAALDRLIILTNASVWSFSGSGGHPLSPVESTPPDAKVHLQIGSSWLDPLVVDNAVLMARTKGSGVRDVLYDLNQQSYVGGNLTASVEHLFRAPTVTPGVPGTRPIVAWCYSEDPWRLVWAALDDGSLLSLTYDRQQGHWAWARHDMLPEAEADAQVAVPAWANRNQGYVESICAVPEGDEDVVYMAVRRITGNIGLVGDAERRIERFASRRMPLDLTTELPSAKDQVALDASVTYRGSAETVITGLDHLNDRQVWALADGNLIGPYIVGRVKSGGSWVVATAGAIDISDAMPDGASVVTVGYRYLPELELLDLAEARTRQKNVTSVTFEVVESRGLEVGESSENTSPWKQRRVDDGYGSIEPATETVKVSVSGRWNMGGRAYLRQTAPLFTTVYAVTREVEVGG